MARPHIAHAWLNLPGVKDALAAGASCAEVAKLAGVSHQAISIYRRAHIRPGLELAIKAREFDRLAAKNGLSSAEVTDAAKFANAAALGSEFLSRSDEVWNLAMEGARNLHKQKKFQATAPLLGQANANLRMYGEHTGALNGAPQNTLNVVLLLPETHVVDQAETIEAVVIDDESTN